VIDRTRCMRSNSSLATVFGAEELKFCQEPATHESKLTGRLCVHHAEEQREALRDPSALINVIRKRVSTEEEISVLVRKLPTNNKDGLQ
jgi:hypothetical protein